MQSNKSIHFFEVQFQRQAREREFELNPFETLALDHLKGTVLDLGAGLGNLSLEAGRRGHRVVSVDASPTAVARINRDAEREGLDVHAITADLGNWSIDGDYDTILMIGLLSFFPRQTAFDLLEAAKEKVKVGGCIVLNVLLEGTQHPDMLDLDSCCLFTPGELEKTFHEWEILATRQDSFSAGGGVSKKLATLIARK